MSLYNVRHMDCRRALILQNTRLQRPPSVPELQLYLAHEIEPIWRVTESEQGGAPPYWAFAWAGGQALARYVLDHPEVVAGKRVVDFATGSGVCALAAMKAGAAHALATDIDGLSGEAVALNARANRLSVTFSNRDLTDVYQLEADVILAGDVCYEQPLANRALAWLRAAHARGTRVLVGDPGRPYSPPEGLIRLAVYEIRTTREIEDTDVKRVGVFTPVG